jgi:hypothetical protein
MVSSLHAAILAIVLAAATAVGIAGAANQMGANSVSPRADRLSVAPGVVVSYVTFETRRSGVSILVRLPSSCDGRVAAEGCRPYRPNQPTEFPDVPDKPAGWPVASDK